MPRDTERRALSRDRFPLLHETTLSLIALLLGRRLANQEVEGRKMALLKVCQPWASTAWVLPPTALRPC